MKRAKDLRSLSLSLSLLLAASAFAAPAYAQISFNVIVAPPAPHYEVVPAMPPGYVWAPGYWGWSGERHVWIRGRTIVHREGYRWAPDGWEQRDRNYYRTVGHWERDHDYKPVKAKKERHHKDRGDGDRGHDNDAKHGRGGEHDG